MDTTEREPMRQHLATSGDRWRGVCVEVHRVVVHHAHAGVAPGEQRRPNRRHVIAVSAGPPAVLRWQQGRRDRSSRVHRGGVIVSPAGHVAPHVWDSNVELVCVTFDVDSVHLGEQATSLRADCNTRDPLIAQLAFALADELAAGGADTTYPDMLAAALGAHLVRRYGGAPQDHAGGRRDHAATKVAEVKDLIEANLGQRLTAPGLAAAVDISASHLTRLFREHVGQAPHAYVLERRAERAVTLIEGTTLPLSTVASTCGFADQSHMNRVVRQRIGLAPSQLRETEP